MGHEDGPGSALRAPLGAEWPQAQMVRTKQQMGHFGPGIAANPTRIGRSALN